MVRVISPDGEGYIDRGMSGYRNFIIEGLLVVGLLMNHCVEAGEEDCLGFAGQEPIMCYECMTVTDDHFCSDPFNSTRPELELRRCKEYCVKWTRKTLSGKLLIQRTCSDKLDIKLRKTSVCIEESRPSEGHLCFCDKNQCNSASELKQNHQLGYTLALVVILLLYR